MKVWQSKVGLGYVRLTSANTLEIVFGRFSEQPTRQRCGRVVYSVPAVYPDYLKRLTQKIFDELWYDKKPAPNDKLPLQQPKYTSKRQRLLTLMEV